MVQQKRTPVYNYDDDCILFGMATNKSRVSFVIPDEVKKELEELAELEGRSVSNYVLYVVKSAIAQAKENRKEKLNVSKLEN